MQKGYSEKIVMIDPKHIHPHPNNPRKDLGDLTELRASVRKNGIMQNLTVIPTDEPGEYMALIGHRRSESARLEELESVPCIVKEGLSELEQLNIMMEENMQRNDLTIYEQAQGFQMMLDLGETADTIAEKTGFSKTTVYHRLNIAKLDQKELENKEKDSDFQLSLKAIYELEKIKDVKTRNEVLKKAFDNQNLITRARSAAMDEKRDEAAKEVVKILKESDVQAAPKGVSYYSNGYEKVKTINLDKELPESIKLQGKGPFYYVKSYGNIYILRKEKKKEKKKTKEEIQKEKIKQNKLQLKSIVTNMDKRRGMLVQDIVSGKISVPKDKSDMRDVLWGHLLEYNASLYCSFMFRFHAGKDNYSATEEEKEETEKWIDSLSAQQQMLVVLSQVMNNMEPYDFNGHYHEERARKYKKALGVLEKYGWYLTEEEQQVLDGTHELYIQDEAGK